MRLAILLRGFHWLPSDRFGFPLDARRCLPSLFQKLVDPLRAGHAVDIFSVTYDSPILSEVLERLAPTESRLCDPRTSDQLSTFAEGLRMVAAARQPYDRVISTRFDLSYLTTADRWNVWGDRRGLFLPWREYEHMWKEHQRVGDVIHVCDAHALQPFIDAIEELRANKQKHLHALYPVVTRHTPDVHFLCEGYHDSNTLFCNRECFNPIYKLGNRPRLPAVETFRPSPPTSSLTSRRIRKVWITAVLAWSHGVVAVAAAISRAWFRLCTRTCASRVSS